MYTLEEIFERIENDKYFRKRLNKLVKAMMKHFTYELAWHPYGKPLCYCLSRCIDSNDGIEENLLHGERCELSDCMRFLIRSMMEEGATFASFGSMSDCNYSEIRKYRKTILLLLIQITKP